MGETLGWVIPGSRLLATDRAAMLQSGSPPDTDGSAIPPRESIKYAFARLSRTRHPTGRAQEQRPLSPLVPTPFSVGLRPLSVLPNHLHQAQRILRRPGINIVVEIDKPS